MSELALKLIREAKETRATRLDLGNCGLTELPDELFELTWLEELILGGSTWESYVWGDKQRIEKYKSNNNGSMNQLSFFPTKIINLKKLKTLIAPENKIINVEAISGLSNLEVLYLNRNSKLTDIKPIENLTNLKELCLDDTKIEDVDSLGNLVNLKELYINEVGIRDLSFMQNLKEIEIFETFDGLFDNLNPLLNALKLKKLIVAEGEIKEISILKEFKNLEFLYLSGNKIKDISPLAELKKLRIFLFEQADFENVNLPKLSESLIECHFHIAGNLEIGAIKNLKKLEILSLERNEISNFNSLIDLTTLKSINLSHTNVLSLDFLNDLIHLQSLNISQTQVNNLIPLENLKKLEYVDISDTQVEDLSPLKKHFNNANFILHSRNSILTTPPQEIVEQGNKAILNYFKQIDIETIKLEIDKTQRIIAKLEQELREKGSMFPNSNYVELVKKELREYMIRLIKLTKALKELTAIELSNFIIEENVTREKVTVDLYEAKLIIVGEGATGKTTLFEKLKDKKHQIGNTPETHGINIYEGLPFKHTHIGDNTFHANLWDFGGQELQYMTHQFFLTPRALYVLMMDARRESPNLAYWFKIISLLGRDNADSTEKVRLLLVFNKRGNSTGTPPQYQDQLKYYADSLDVQYLEVDFAENDYRFDNLQNAIQQSLVTLPIVKSQLPRLWKAVREDLREEAKTENYIDTKRFSAICSKQGITEEEDQLFLSRYLHQLGSLLHFQNDKGLRRLVILSPQWAVDGVYTFLSEESIARNNGRFTETEFLALLARRAYNRDDADVILQLMTKNNFDICYEATEHNYVAAQLLPDNAPQYSWFPREVLQFRYQYPIMPKGLMSRLIVRLSDDIERDKTNDEQIVWKKGVVLHFKRKENEECRVRLREDDAESKAGLRQILIDVMGDRDARKYALRKVRDTVDDLHKRWFRSIKADEMVPCCCSECKISDNPQLYKLENLLKRRLKRHDTSCDVSGEDLMIQQLLEGVYDKGEIRDMENQGKY